jgi:probable phosphoglycerate mutase
LEFYGGMAHTSPNPERGTPPSRAFLVRHGETSWSQTLRHTSRTDLELNREGVEQARALGRRLAGHHFERVLTSPLKRARETCRLAGLDGRAEVVPDLVEWDYGELEGQTTTAIRTEHPGWVLWSDGAPGGEQVSDVAKRAQRVADEVRATRGDVALFAHGHFLRVLASVWVGVPPETGRCLALDAGSISVLGWEHELPVIERWNDCGSLL